MDIRRLIMLLLNNALLNRDGIVQTFFKEVLDKAEPTLSTAFSLLARFRTKLKHNYFFNEKSLDNEEVLSRLTHESRFNQYPEIQEVLRIIFSASDTQDQESKAALLMQLNACRAQSI